MNKLCSLLILTLLTGLAGAAEVAGFLNDFDAARQQAQQQDKLIYAHFTTEWCGWCRRIEQETYPDPAVREAFEDWVPVSLDCTVAEGGEPDAQTRRNLALFYKYEGGGYPFLAMLRPDGALLNAVPGYVRPPQLIAALAEAQANRDRLVAAEQAYAQADPNDYDAHLTAMRVFDEFYLNERAAEAASHVIRLDPENEHGDHAEANWMRVQVAATEAASDPNALARLEDLAAATAEADEGNAGGFMEQALTTVSEAHIRIGMGSDSVDVRRARLVSAAEALTTLTERADQLENAVAIHGRLGDLKYALGEPAEAVAQWSAALNAGPDQRSAVRLQQKIRQVSAQLDRGGSS